ncbi:MAG: FAD-binding oxidoreductase [Burkholderiales bacterium]|nr:FAD-binding oxidoreductase [Burkholderiales bacterium]
MTSGSQTIKADSAAHEACDRSVDVAIIGAGIQGASIAWWLMRLDPALRVALIERDTGFSQASSQRSASSIRQQFSHPINIQLSQFGLQFLRESSSLLAVDGEAPAIGLTDPGYLYLARHEGAQSLRDQHALQRQHGAPIELLERDALAQRFAWLRTGDLALGTLGAGAEGWFDGPALHQAMLRAARAQGATLIRGEVVGFEMAQAGRSAAGAASAAGKIAALRLADGTRLVCGTAVNAAGAWARPLAKAAGIDLPVHARRRTVFVFSCPTTLADCPLVIDPSGFWFRPEGRQFIGGRTPDDDADDLPLEPNLAEFDEAFWTGLAHRVPAFEALRIENAWAGYYEMNLFDHNALLGAHPTVDNLLFATGFSGHGMQQAPAVGRGIAELIVHGAYRSLDLSVLSVARLTEGRRIVEANVIG